MPSRPNLRPEFEFAAAIFLGALLLFQVQPMISKFILPWFGGGPAIWTVCMFFFQALLFVGYAYAYLMTRVFSLKAQFVINTILMIVALLQLPIAPDSSWKPESGQAPTQEILLLLIASIGMPYFLLSTTSPLVQAWYARVRPAQSPYRLYALSNLGSLLALLTYPFLIEPNINNQQQSTVWSVLFVFFVILYLASAIRVLRAQAVPDSRPPVDSAKQPAKFTAPPAMGLMCLWFGLSMTGSVMLLAVTNAISIDVAVVPFLWVLPLTLYLLSFIISFGSARLSARIPWALLWVASVVVSLPLVVTPFGGSTAIVKQLAIYLALLFTCCMVCHGELVRHKPDPRYLTTFYLILAAGGAGGGIFTAVIAPRIFPTFLEFQLVLVATTGLMMVIYFFDKGWYLYRGRQVWAWGIILLMFAVLLAAVVRDFVETIHKVHLITRNFYGVLRVEPKQMKTQDWIYELLHGRTVHGSQFALEERYDWPTSYYGKNSGLGIVMRNHRSGEPRQVGIVGLGVGTVCTYAKEGDRYRFYEINPDVIFLAHEFFMYLQICRGEVTIVEGDARISLETEPANNFDVLVLDAFSSDAIPVHLLTREAFDLYLRHLAPNGVLAVHISNRHLDLLPILAAHARSFDLNLLSIKSKADKDRGQNSSHWALLARSADSLDIEQLQKNKEPDPDREVVWTDDRNSLFQIMK